MMYSNSASTNIFSSPSGSGRNLSSAPRRPELTGDEPDVGSKTAHAWKKSGPPNLRSKSRLGSALLLVSSRLRRRTARVELRVAALAVATVSK